MNLEPLVTNATPSSADHRAVARFFTAFDEAFVSFDGDVIAERYGEPYLACRQDGSAQSFTNRRDIGWYFQRVVDGYRDRGVLTCRHRDLEVALLSSPHLLGTVTWELLGADAALVVSWRESYLLVPDGDHLLVRSSIDHASQW